VNRMRRHFTHARTLPGLEDSIDTERLRFRAEPGTPPAGGGGGEGGEGGAPAPGGEGSGTPPTPALTPPAPTPTPAPPAGNGDGGGDEFDRERAMATIRAQRESEDRLKAELKREREERERIERGQLTPEEQKEHDRKAAESRADAAEARARQAELLGTLATREDIADAEIARDLLIARGLQFGDDGKPVDLDTAVTSLLEAKPVLKKGEAPAPGGDGAGGGDGGGQGGSPAGGGTPPAGNGAAGSGGQGPPPQLTAEEVQAANDAGQSVEQYAALRDSARKSRGRVSLSDWESAKPPAPVQE